MARHYPQVETSIEEAEQGTTAELTENSLGNAELASECVMLTRSRLYLNQYL